MSESNVGLITFLDMMACGVSFLQMVMSSLSDSFIHSHEHHKP